jgi:hypothetical protein
VSPGPHLKAARTQKLRAIAEDAANLAGCAQRVSEAAREAADGVGAAQLQKQMAFLTGALARMQKDWGAVEYIQFTLGSPRNLER